MRHGRALRIAILLAVCAGAVVALKIYLRPWPANAASAVLSAGLLARAQASELAGWAALPVLRARRYELQSSTQLAERTYDYGLLARLALRGSPLFFVDNRDMNNARCRGRNTRAHAAQTIPLELEQALCSELHVQGFVLARFEGPGVLSRLWLTLLTALERMPSETLRVYVDAQAEPIATLPVRAFLEPARAPILRAPFSAELRYAVAWYAPIAYDEQLIISLDDVDALQSVYFEAAALRGAPEPSPKLEVEQARDALRAVGAPSTDPLHARHMTLTPGASDALELDGPATITALSIGFDESARSALRDVQLRVTWDERSESAIALPILDLFNASHALPTNGTPALGARVQGARVVLETRLPMPFAGHATLLVENRGPTAVALELEVQVGSGVPAGAWGHLHVQRAEARHTGEGRVHRVLDASGRGRLVGVCARLRGALGDDGAPFFLEGDMAMNIDGRALRGTGTEDYFNGAFFFADGQTMSPFSQVWGLRHGDEAFDVSACRWHVLHDAIDFARTLEVTLEVGPTAGADYVTLAYAYR